ncbi:hypothetical protein N7527_009172 [Penicillium freii]|nr:hypothetical protein N7527_009172 [Penicillium freii]
MRLQSTAAVSLLFTVGTSARSIIHSGQGFGTYYYDIGQVDHCGTTFEYQNKGGVMCNSAALLSLDQMNTKYVVAMNNTQLGTAPDIWDAEGAPGLGFSYTVLNKLSGGNACKDGHVAISWEILDETIHFFHGSSSSFDSLSEPKSPNAAAAKSFTQCPDQTETPATMTVGTSATQDTPFSIACSENAWQCNGAVLEQCISTIWTPRVTCTAGYNCQGGSNPYCV